MSVSWRGLFVWLGILIVQSLFVSKYQIEGWMTTIPSKYDWSFHNKVKSHTSSASLFHPNHVFLPFRNQKQRITICFSSNQKDDDDDDAQVVMNGEEDYEEMEEEDDLNNMEPKIRVRARVAYDGTGFQGWQVQNNKSNSNSNQKRTIQGELQAVLSQRFQRSVTVVGAGRTDTGVHARGQAIHFDLYPHELLGSAKSTSDSADRSSGTAFLSSLENSLNRMLRRDVRVWNLGIAPIRQDDDTYAIEEDLRTIQHQIPKKRWHVIFHAKSKLYSYRLSTGRAMNPNHRHTRVHFHDVHLTSSSEQERMREILSTFVGTHEFAAFAGQIEVNERKSGKKKNTIRTVYQIDLIDEGNDNYRIDIYLKGALYKMIRNMIGTALDVYRGKVQLQTMQQMLHIQNTGKTTDPNPTIVPVTRTNNKSKPVPPEGLTMENVFFEDGIF